jgi:hypothetical protein
VQLESYPPLLHVGELLPPLAGWCCMYSRNHTQDLFGAVPPSSPLTKVILRTVRRARCCTNHCPCSARDPAPTAARDHPSPLNHGPFTSMLPHAGRAEANPARRIHERACHRAPTNDSQSVPGAATVPAYYWESAHALSFSRELGSPFSSVLPGPLPCLPIARLADPQHPGKNMIGSHDPSRAVLERRQHLIFVCMRAIVTVRASPSGMAPPMSAQKPSPEDLHGVP